MEFNQIRNVLVGNNGAGKSTIIEAIRLALGECDFNYEITQYSFHKSVWDISRVDHPSNLPKIEIEIYFSDDLDKPEFRGKNNLLGEECPGLRFTYEFDEDLAEQYQNKKKHKYIPCEYYSQVRLWFSGEIAKKKLNPFKTFVIDSSNSYFNSRPRQFVAHLLEDDTDDFQPQMLSCLALMKSQFDSDEDVRQLNHTLSSRAQEVKQGLGISVDLTSRNSYSAILSPFVDGIPFENAGMGEQYIVKTLLSLGENKEDSKPRLIIIEEPETHLSHTMMYELINLISSRTTHQIILTTHSSFVANRLELDNLIVIHKDLAGTVSPKKLNQLRHCDSYKYFFKSTDFSTLRIILCKKAILVEGPTDEMVCQYYMKSKSIPAFHKGVELMAVGGVSFKHFINLAKDLGIRLSIVRDRDNGNRDIYETDYFGDEEHPEIALFLDDDHSTIEPSFVYANLNDFKRLSDVVRVNKANNETLDSLMKFMSSNKTEWSYRLLQSAENFEVPKYIKDAIAWVYD